MKSTMLAVLTFSVLSGVPSSSAQVFGEKLVATIPFEFHAGGKVLPSGRYEVKDLQRGLVLVSRVDSPAAVAAISTHECSRKVSGEPSGVLLFERYGDHYRLSSIFAPGQPVGKMLPVPKSWKAIRESMALNPEQRTVEIALSTSR